MSGCRNTGCADQNPLKPGHRCPSCPERAQAMAIAEQIFSLTDLQVRESFDRRGRPPENVSINFHHYEMLKAMIRDEDVPNVRKAPAPTLRYPGRYGF